MKTNVVMKSSDRELFGVVIKQNTKEGQSLSVTDLQLAYNKARFQYAWGERRVSTIMDTAQFSERCFYILKEKGVIKAGFDAFMEMVEKEGIVKVLKGLGVWKTKGRGENKSVYCDPYIWVLLAMELNPMVYAKVVIWLTDTLVFKRMEAGTNHILMTSAVKRLCSNPDYAEISRQINIKVFGRHEREIRNTATDEQLKLIAEIEKFIAQAIGFGMIEDETGVLNIIKNFKNPIAIAA